MPDTVTSQLIFDGENKAVMKFTNLSDGTGETDVLKVNASTLARNAANQLCTGLKLVRIHAAINGMSVQLTWDAAVDVPAVILAPGMYTFDHSDLALPNNAGAGRTGNILLSTIGAAIGRTYSIVLEMQKTYG